MMKYQTVLAGAFGALLLVPTFATQDTGGGLQRSLEETVRALEVLAGIQKGIQQGAPNSVSLVMQATEPATGDAQSRDAQLVGLRDEVNRLQGVSDRMNEAGNPSQTVETLLQGKPEEALRLSVSTGLSAHDRGALQSGASTNGTSPAAQPVAAPAVYTEADPVRQAQTLYRSGRYADCVVFLDNKTSNLEAAWWRARALEQLERWPEAIDGYKQASASTDPALARRAKQDLEFLEWKRDFKLKAGKNNPKDAQ